MNNLKMKKLLYGKSAIVTGASRGIGLGIANAFVKNGAEVAIFDIASKPCNLSRNIEYYCVNITNNKEVESAFRKVIKGFGKIDVLVNNAGIIIREAFLDITEDSWDMHFDVNCKGTFLCCQKALKYMTSMKTNGSIINISSIAGKIARSKQASYCSSKAAVIHLTECLAIEFAPFNIRINCICPGMTYSEMLEDMFKRESIDKKEVSDNIPLKKFADFKDHAEMAVFLASEKSSHITGQIITIDGGQSLNFVY